MQEKKHVSSSQARKFSGVKSLLSFAHRLGYTAFNVGAVVKLPSIKGTLAERIMSEPDMQRMLALETDPRNAALLRLSTAPACASARSAG
jgi:site-specific recombinase XerD